MAGVSTQPPGRRVAFHPPCSLQHGQQVRGHVEAILQALGWELLAFNEPHLCCGSAGTYSILQKNMAEKLRDRKLQHIEVEQPDIIATANIGCLLHLQKKGECSVVVANRDAGQALDRTAGLTRSSAYPQRRYVVATAHSWQNSRHFFNQNTHRP